ncbi:hypothetical protein PoB_007410300 [Plakobranchus ocellatus]|uniref:Uncharacterized protein n=1 Tax=Plakobranchus ocellatus TaxID=259542 RepID=A0AAV4DTG4_9GAST|nr:hypothetical protein PoB_007410300 [Plakobranchus ocellatus]
MLSALRSLWVPTPSFLSPNSYLSLSLSPNPTFTYAHAVCIMARFRVYLAAETTSVGSVGDGRRYRSQSGKQERTVPRFPRRNSSVL